MIFILKKIISAFLMPLSIGLFLLFAGVYYLFKNNLKKAKLFVMFGVFWISLVSHVSFANFLLYPLESAYPKLKTIPQDIEYVLLLGGDRTKRAWEVLKLFHKNPNLNIIVSGYEGRGKVPEAIKTAKQLVNSGVPKNKIIINTKPKDTIEEAKKIKKMLKTKKFILITSAYHMKRAMIIFKSFGLNPIPAPTDFLIKDSDKLLSMPSGRGLIKSEIAWHEYLGILFFNLKSFFRS